MHPSSLKSFGDADQGPPSPNRWKLLNLSSGSQTFRSQTALPFFFSYLNKVLLEDSCFTILCWFLQYSKVSQPYLCIYPLFWIFFPFRSPQSTELYSRFSLVTYVIYSHVYVNPNLSVHPTPFPHPMVSIHLCQTPSYF